MKIKTILITAVLVIGAGTATSYFVRRSHESNIVKVEVVPVTSVNNAAYSMGDSSTVSGTIISKDTQVVALDSSHELKNVYVQQGDRVKKGDKLLEYDMLGDELKEEMEELTKMGLELTLESMKKDLETLKSGRMPESMGGGESGYSTSMDSDDDDDGADEDDGDDDAGSAANVDASGRSHVNAGVTQQGGGAVGAADTLAQKPLTLAGAYSKPAAKLTVKPSAKQTQKPAGKLPSTPVWTPSAFLHALQQLQEDMQEGMQEETSDPADGILKSEGDEIVSDDSSLLPAESWDDLLPENEESVDAPLTASDLFDTSDQETVQSVIPDAIGIKRRAVRDTAKAERVLVINGSLNPITKRQIAYALGRGIHRICITDEERLCGNFSEARLGQIAEECRHYAGMLIDGSCCSTTGRAEMTSCLRDSEHSTIQRQIPVSLGKIARKILESMDVMLVVFGGDTLLGVLDQLRVKEITPLTELEPGVVLSTFDWCGKKHSLVSKSGGMGKESAIMDILEKVMHGEENDYAETI